MKAAAIQIAWFSILVRFGQIDLINQELIYSHIMSIARRLYGTIEKKSVSRTH
ncbi:Hypothetical protein GbCGDNIH1_8016 [Granulibacter bethesdensis CGDNIH1]|uniref:Uncharacterized protein n=1 Tax=Granulibacter bethesdensis (strain ATCC BAA-1260 / CGDNIH1) TaxID=391165 RepID=A0A286M310_GRABC|nr:Hypothetical protein GbCGDNIH5_8016 [Granulibacter bethesdensis]APH64601.1 Hypothetical protein GbCGDNIH1I4_8016 [Granulibacter bethesdensis]ASV62409.1 Hypothetical protein GbCGDNIH1_8016 [Granulibacter bethesdensis CGDNIH1]